MEGGGPVKGGCVACGGVAVASEATLGREGGDKLVVECIQEIR